MSGAYYEFNENVREFLANLTLDFRAGNIIIDLMDLLPLAKQSIIRWDSLRLLLITYSWLHDKHSRMQYFIFNEPLKKCLSTNKTGGTSHEIDDLIDLSHTGNHKYYREGALNSEMYEIRNIHIFVAHFFRDHENFYSSLKVNNFAESSISISISQYNEMITTIRSCPNVCNLCIGIVSSDLKCVYNRLRYISPFNNNFMAYKLALQRGDQEIINLVLKQIMSRYLLHREVLIKYILPMDIYTIISSMF